MSDPVLPYGTGRGRNSGYATGAATSEARARRDDADGITSRRQNLALRELATGRPGFRGASYGLTWKELADLTGWHHGQASGVLSVLHKAGKIARLTDRRHRCFIYVLPEHVNGRDTQEQGRPRQPDDGLAIALIEAEAIILRVEALLGDCEYEAPGGITRCVAVSPDACLPCRIRATIGRE